MTIAELHGKISSSGVNLTDRLEDLLTSDVFGTCKYLPYKILLLPFISTAVDHNGISLAKQLEHSARSIEYRFWPKLKFSEPDLLIHIRSKNNHDQILMIEAKYLSGKSGSAFSEEELVNAETPRDQLARELVDLSEYDANGDTSGMDRTLVYVTAHRFCPKLSLAESLREFRVLFPSRDLPSLYWTSWIRLSGVVNALNTSNLSQYERSLIIDLQDLLRKKGLIRFSGICGYEQIRKSNWTYVRGNQLIANELYMFNLTYRKLTWIYKSGKGFKRSYCWQVPLQKGHTDGYRTRRDNT